MNSKIIKSIKIKKSLNSTPINNKNEQLLKNES
jgi:hypothetical protein